MLFDTGSLGSAVLLCLLSSWKEYRCEQSHPTKNNNILNAEILLKEIY
jgi:hypothetical protein